tara:strand:- start:1305 stop:2621 length:1317 start_codon:yes stop_codon:yes gene_type:complete
MLAFAIPKRKEILFCFLFGIIIYIIFIFTDGRIIKDAESITFGFGPIIKSILNNSGYKASNILYPGGVNHDSYAHRMPLIPIWFAFFGGNIKLATFIRALFFGFISLPAIRMLKKMSGEKITIYALFIILLSPLFLRRIVDITNEESWLSIFIPCSFIGMCYLKERLEDRREECLSTGIYVSILLALSYLTKSSMLYLAVAVLMFIFIRSYRLRELRYTNIVLFSLPLLTAITCWNFHVFLTTQHLTLGTSWDGWNILKGNNAYFSEYFPTRSLDILDYKGLIKVSSEKINSEWSIDKDLKDQAIIWIYNNPIQFIKNTIHKFYIILFDPRILPVMPWHKNHTFAIHLTSISLLFTKLTSLILIFPALSKRINIPIFYKSFKFLKSQKNIDLYLIYMFFYFSPFLIGKYDVRHYVPMIPVIIALTAIRFANKNRVSYN